MVTKSKKTQVVKKSPVLKKKARFSVILMIMIILLIAVPGIYLVYSSYAGEGISYKWKDCTLKNMATKRIGSNDSRTVQVTGKVGLAVGSKITVEWGLGSKNTYVSHNQSNHKFSIKHTYPIDYDNKQVRKITVTAFCPYASIIDMDGTHRNWVTKVLRWTQNKTKLPS